MKIIRVNNDNINYVIDVENSLEHNILSNTVIQKEIDNNSTMYFAYADEDVAQGYIAFENMIDHIDLISIAVKKEYRQKGIGTSLLSHLFNFAKENNINEIFLEVRKSNIQAISFYEKNGFLKISTREKYYADNYEDAYIYKRII